jgi:hypothetical protein
VGINSKWNTKNDKNKKIGGKQDVKKTNRNNI